MGDKPRFRTRFAKQTRSFITLHEQQDALCGVVDDANVCLGVLPLATDGELKILSRLGERVRFFVFYELEVVPDEVDEGGCLVGRD